MSVLGRRTIQNVYGVGSPTVGRTSSSVRLHIYVTSHYITEISLHVMLSSQSHSLDVVMVFWNWILQL